LAQTQTVLDNFNTISYSNNNGNTSWSSDWTESGDDYDPNNGYINITPAGELKLHYIWSEMIVRSVDLSAAVSATLSFTINASNLPVTKSLNIQISKNGSDFTNLETISGAHNGVKSYNIPNIFFSSTTTIRLANFEDNWATGDEVLVDNVQISYTSSPTIDLVKAFSESCLGTNDGMIQFYETTPEIHSGLEFSINNGVDWQSFTIFTGLSSGNYRLRIKSVDGKISDAFPLVVETASNINLLVDNLKPTSCDGLADGSIEITASGGRNGSLQTNGTTGLVDLQGFFLANLNAFTMEGWVKLNEPISTYTGQQSFFGQNDVIEFGFEANKFTCWTKKGGKIQYPIANYPDDQQWHHVAVVGTGTELRLFIDGNRVEVKTHRSLDPIVGYGDDRNHTARIGAGVWDGDSEDPFKGLFSEVRFWNDVRTNSEIQANKYLNIAGDEQGLMAMYKFDVAPDGNKIYGIGPEATIGLVSGGAEWVDTDPVYAYSWIGPNGFSSTDEDITFLEDGDYTLIVSSANSCDYSETINVAVGNGTANINLDLAVDDATCLNEDGNVNVTVSATDNANAFKFENTGAYTDPVNNFNLQKGTLEAWVYPNGVGSEQTIYCLANGPRNIDHLYRMWIDSAGKINFTTNGGQTITSDESVHVGQWNYIAVAWSTTSSVLIVNNKAENNSGLTVNTNGYPYLFVGDNWWNQYFPFRGYMRELRIWTDVRTTNDLLSFKSQSLKGIENDLLAYWKLNEGAGNNIYDSKNNFRLRVDLAGSWLIHTDIYSFTWTRDGDAAIISSAKDLLNVAKGDYNLKVSQFNDCSTNQSVTVSGTPDDGLAVVGDTKCESEDATVVVKNSEIGVIYFLYLGATQVGSSVNGTGSDLSFVIPTTGFVIGNNVLTVRASIGSCELNLQNTATVNINPKPKPKDISFD